jgi:hypothetical protein
MQDKIWTYPCPFCGHGTITALKNKSGQYAGRPDWFFEYKGGCCSYYPKKNKIVDEAIKRMRKC